MLLFRISTHPTTVGLRFRPRHDTFLYLWVVYPLNQTKSLTNLIGGFAYGVSATVLHEAQCR